MHITYIAYSVLYVLCQNLAGCWFGSLTSLYFQVDLSGMEWTRGRLLIFGKAL